MHFRQRSNQKKKNESNRKTSSLDNVLSSLKKRGKVSTLEKSKKDWEEFKKQEGIEDELKYHAKSGFGKTSFFFFFFFHFFSSLFVAHVIQTTVIRKLQILGEEGIFGTNRNQRV